MGLALARKILQIYGGFLNLESKLNESTIAEFGVPLIKENFFFDESQLVYRRDYEKLGN